MKKADMTSDDLRPEYHREDFGPMMRGKYAARLREASNIVVLDPEIAEVFPNAKLSMTLCAACWNLPKRARFSPRSQPPPPLRPCSHRGSPSPRPPTASPSYWRRWSRWAKRARRSRGGSWGSGGLFLQQNLRRRESGAARAVLSRNGLLN